MRIHLPPDGDERLEAPLPEFRQRLSDFERPVRIPLPFQREEGLGARGRPGDVRGDPGRDAEQAGQKGKDQPFSHQYYFKRFLAVAEKTTFDIGQELTSGQRSVGACCKNDRPGPLWVSLGGGAS